MTTIKKALQLTFVGLLLTPMGFVGSSMLQANGNGPQAITDGSLIKSEHSPDVFVVDRGKRHLIPDRITMESKWPNAQVQTVPQHVVDSIPLGEPVPSIRAREGSLIRSEHSPEVYLVDKGKRHLIPDDETLHAKWPHHEVETLPQRTIDSIPLGEPVHSVK